MGKKKQDRDFSIMCLNIQGMTRMLYSELNSKKGVPSPSAHELARKILAEASHLHSVITSQE
jgi:hypothetical protein